MQSCICRTALILTGLDCERRCKRSRIVLNSIVDGPPEEILAQTLQPRCAAGMAKGPIPAITSRMTSLGLKVPTRRVCSCSSREFQYTCSRAQLAHATLLPKWQIIEIAP